MKKTSDVLTYINDPDFAKMQKKIIKSTMKNNIHNLLIFIKT